MANDALLHWLPMDDYTLLGFKNPRRAQIITKATSIIFMKGECGLNRQIAHVP